MNYICYMFKILYDLHTKWGGGTDDVQKSERKVLQGKLGEEKVKRRQGIGFHDMSVESTSDRSCNGCPLLLATISNQSLVSGL